MRAFKALTISFFLYGVTSAIPITSFEKVFPKKNDTGQTDLSIHKHDDHLPASEMIIPEIEKSMVPEDSKKPKSATSRSNKKEIKPPKNALPNTKQHTAKQAKLVSSFVRRLRSYVHGYCFRYESFELRENKLQKELIHLGRLIEDSNSTDKALASRLGFARYMFGVMQNAVDPFKLNQMIDTPGSQLVNRLVEFNIELLTYYNSRGVPDTRFRGYGSLVHKFIELLESWREQFTSMQNEPSNVRAMFNNQFKLAERRLVEMKQYIGVG